LKGFLARGRMKSMGYAVLPDGISEEKVLIKTLSGQGNLTACSFGRYIRRAGREDDPFSGYRGPVNPAGIS